MKLDGVEVSETVCCLRYRSRLAEVAWEALSVVSLVLSGIRHVGRDIDQLVSLVCSALSRPYKRSNWHPRPIQWPIIHWQALDFMIDWTAQKRGTPRCDAPAIEVVPFVGCEMP